MPVETHAQVCTMPWCVDVRRGENTRLTEKHTERRLPASLTRLLKVSIKPRCSLVVVPNLVAEKLWAKGPPRYISTGSTMSASITQSPKHRPCRIMISPDCLLSSHVRERNVKNEGEQEHRYQLQQHRINAARYWASFFF